jgi:hypothetical protein
MDSPSLKITFTQSVAVAMNINNNSVVIGNISQVSSTRRMSISSLRSERGLSATPALNIDYAVIIVMQSLGFQDPDEAVSSLIDSIQGSVSTGEFLDILKEVSQTYSMDIFADASTPAVTITKVVLSYNSPAPSTAPTMLPTSLVVKSRSSQAFISSNGGLIVIVVVAGVVLIGLLTFCYFCVYGFKFPAKISHHPRTPDFHHVDVRPTARENVNNQLIFPNDHELFGTSGGDDRYHVGNSEEVAL